MKRVVKVMKRMKGRKRWMMKRVVKVMKRTKGRKR